MGTNNYNHGPYAMTRHGWAKPVHMMSDDDFDGKYPPRVLTQEEVQRLQDQDTADVIGRRSATALPWATGLGGIVTFFVVVGGPTQTERFALVLPNSHFRHTFCSQTL